MKCRSSFVLNIFLFFLELVFLFAISLFSTLFQWWLIHTSRNKHMETVKRNRETKRTIRVCFDNWKGIEKKTVEHFSCIYGLSFSIRKIELCVFVWNENFNIPLRTPTIALGKYTKSTLHCPYTYIQTNTKNVDGNENENFTTRTDTRKPNTRIHTHTHNGC